jgi:hypothetical protein
MRWLLASLLTVAAGEWCTVRAQTPLDTMPERVVSQAYDAFNRHDPAAFLSFFAPVWYHTLLSDSVGGPTRQVREENIRDYVARDAFHSKPTITVIRRLVVGPYVIDEQIRGRDSTRRLDIFEVRKGKIVHEWESGPIPRN